MFVSLKSNWTKPGPLVGRWSKESVVIIMDDGVSINNSSQLSFCCFLFILARYHAQSYSVCIAREAAGLEHDAAKTTGSRCGRIVLILNNRVYVN